MHFVLSIFLLFFSLFIPSEACLKVESSVTTTTTEITTTAIPFCNDCVFALLDADNIETYIKDHPAYPNIRKHGVIPPKVEWDGCNLTLSCPSDYDLVALSDTNYRVFNRFILEGVCDKQSSQWTIGLPDDYKDIFAQLYGLCVKFNSPCPCSWEVLTNENAYNLIGSSSFYQQLTQAPLKYTPNITYDENECPKHFDCTPSTVSWYYDMTSYEVSWAQADVTCNTETLIWDTHTDRPLTTKKLYPVCYSNDELHTVCGCKFNSINENFGSSLYKDYPFIENNASFYRFYRANFTIRGGCVIQFPCEANLTMVIMGKNTFVANYKEAFASCSDDASYWNVYAIDSVFKERPNILVICVDYSKTIKCPCTIGTFNNSAGHSYSDDFPFLEANSTQYTYYTAELQVGSGGCVEKASCPSEQIMAILGKETAIVKNGEASLTCSGNDGVTLSYDGITRQERSKILVICMVPK